MNHSFTLPVATFALIGAAATAVAIDTSKLPPASKQQGVTYAKDIQPILQTSCIRSHGEERPKGGLRLDSLEGVLKGGKDGKIVMPRDSANSKMVVAVSQLDPEFVMLPKPRGGPGGRRGPGGSGNKRHGEGFRGPRGTNAPPAGQRSGGFGGPGGPGSFGPPPKPLTPEQVSLISAWIDQGAM